jgi:hypothetical protein
MGTFLQIDKIFVYQLSDKHIYFEMKGDYERKLEFCNKYLFIMSKMTNMATVLKSEVKTCVTNSFLGNISSKNYRHTYMYSVSSSRNMYHPDCNWYFIVSASHYEYTDTLESAVKLKCLNFVTFTF